MKYLLNCTSSNEYDNADCSAAVIDLSPELAKKILARRKTLLSMQTEDGDLSEVRYNSPDAVFYDTVEGPDGDVPLPLNEDFEGEEQPVWVEMVICDHGMWWVGFPEHADLTVSTELLDYNFIEQHIGEPCPGSSTSA